MGEKKKQCRFTLQFSETDPQHQKVAKILNRQGRRKAQYIVNAVLSYEHGMGEDANKEKIPTDFNRLEAVVNQILKEKLSALRQQENNTASPSERLHKTEEIPSMDRFLNDSEDGLAAITNSIAAFRHKALL